MQLRSRLTCRLLALTLSSAIGALSLHSQPMTGEGSPAVGPGIVGPVHGHGDGSAVEQKLEKLPVYHPATTSRDRGDWLLDEVPAPAQVFRNSEGSDLILSNGLVRRQFRLLPSMTCFGFTNLVTGEEMIRALKPEAEVEIDGKRYAIGGVKGQFEHAYLDTAWLHELSPDPGAFHLVDLAVDDLQPDFPWLPVRWTADRQWPPKGKRVDFVFAPPHGTLPGVTVIVHYELFDRIPLVGKWISLRNEGANDIRLDAFENEILAVVESGNMTGPDGHLTVPHMFVESDYAFGGMDAGGANRTIVWLPDSTYTTQVNYEYRTPCLLVSKPPIGPWYRLRPHDTFEAYRTYEMLYDSYDKERCGLEKRRVYRTLAPWVAENPIFLHLTTTDPDEVKAAIDQCAAVGFEMVILSFGSGLNMEDTSAANITRFRELVDYGRRKGIELGGYSLFSSRSIDASDDVINPRTGRPGGAIFGNAPCLGSAWGLGYLERLKSFITRTGFRVLENDGPYPGDVCASRSHPGHEGEFDSQWKQWRLETSFYRWLRERDVYLNAPDWYFLAGSSKTGMGYRETDWSLPRAQQVIIERQNIYDGTWEKTPSMGWMFVPLVQYHGGGAAATLEPLHEHLEEYRTRLFQNFSSGVQACYRGPRLFDASETEAMVNREVSWYKAHRAILNSDIIHLRRGDGRDWDGILHVNPRLKEKGLAVIYNPLNRAIRRTIVLPLYYTGLKMKARVRERDEAAKEYVLDCDRSVAVTLEIPPKGYTWLVIE
jgi:hypothetical protein